MQAYDYRIRAGFAVAEKSMLSTERFSTSSRSEAARFDEIPVLVQRCFCRRSDRIKDKTHVHSPIVSTCALHSMA